MRLIYLLSAAFFAATAAHAEQMQISRIDAMSAFNAISQIGEYQDSIKQAGQEVPVKRFLKVSPAMRSTLQHDATVLRALSLETMALNQSGDAQIDADPKYTTDDARRSAKVAAQTVIGQQMVSVDLMRFSEGDLALGDNPQITPSLGAALSALIQKDAK